MTLDEYQMSDATGSAEFVAKGEVHPHELLELGHGSVGGDRPAP